MRTMRPKRFWVFALTSLAAALALASPGYAGWDPLLRSSQYFSEGYNAADFRYGTPSGIAIADFDGNGKPDIATSNLSGGYDVLLHANDPRSRQMFPPALRYQANASGVESDVATADFNSDGRPDLAVVNESEVRVQLRTSTGFAPPKVYPDDGADKIVVGDVNSDGRLDVITGGNLDFAPQIGIKVMLGMPADTLSQPVMYFAPLNASSPGDMVLADATGDGVLDVVMTVDTGSTFVIEIMKGAGDGTFTPGSLSTGATSDPGGVAVGDLNGDTVPDVVAACPGTGQIKFFQGLGNNVFLSPVSIALPIMPSAVCLGDVDGDGDADIVAVTKDPTRTVGSVGVVKNAGGGNFAAPVTYSGLPGAGDAALVDMDLDGRLDIVAAMSCKSNIEGDTSARSHTVGMLLNDGTGGFRGGILGVQVDPATPPTAEVVGDFDRDGIPDLAVATEFNVSLAHGLGNGTFGIPSTISSQANAQRIFAVDINRNGTLDLILAGPTGGALLLNNGSGPFTSNAAPANACAVFDMNRDGVMDVLTESGGNFTPYITSASGTTFTPRTSFASGTPSDVVVGDWNRDGIPDFATATPTGVQTYQGVGNGDFMPPNTVQTGRVYTAICSADFNRDGIPDLAARENTQNVSSLEYFTRGVDVFQGASNGTFTLVRSIGTTEQRGWLLAAWDTNRDGLTDLISSSVSDAINSTNPQVGIDVLLNGDANQFDMRADYVLGALSPVGGANPVPNRRFATGDVDRDGMPDVLPAILSGSATAGLIHTVLSTPPARDNSLNNAAFYAAGLNPNSLAVGDLNRDGVLDVVSGMGSSGPGVAVSLGASNGTLGAGTVLTQSVAAPRVGLADLNRDGILDIVSSNGGLVGPGISTMLGVGDGTFGIRNFYVFSAGADFEIGDMNRDGIPDVVATALSGITDTLRVLLGTGSGTFTGAPGIPLQHIYDLDLADLNRDGFLDVVVAVGSVKVLYGGPGGSLIPPQTVPVPVTNCHTLCVADFNRDGFLDIAADNAGAIYVTWGAAASPFTTFASTSLPFTASDLKVGEAEANGTPYIYATHSPNGLELLSVATNGSLSVAGAYTVTSQAETVALGDLDRDGGLDVFTAGAGGSVVSVNLHGLGVVTGIDGPGQAPPAPQHASLRQNYPNPFNPRTTIRYSLPQAERVTLRVFDVHGRLTATLRDDTEPAGEHLVDWDGRDREGLPVASGVYLYRLSTAPGEDLSRRMVVVK